MFEHEDSLSRLSTSVPLREKLELIHSVVEGRHSFVERIAVAVHDPETDLLKTFVASCDGIDPLLHYQAKLADCASLARSPTRRRPRVINDLRELGDEREHSRRIADEGYRASYTLPIFMNQRLFGFVFFDARAAGVFTADVLPDFDLFGHLVSLRDRQRGSGDPHAAGGAPHGAGHDPTPRRRDRSARRPHGALLAPDRPRTGRSARLRRRVHRARLHVRAAARHRQDRRRRPGAAQTRPPDRGRGAPDAYPRGQGPPVGGLRCSRTSASTASSTSRCCSTSCSTTTNHPTARAIRAGCAAARSPSRPASSRSPTSSTP